MHARILFRSPYLINDDFEFISFSVAKTLSKLTVREMTCSCLFLDMTVCLICCKIFPALFFAPHGKCHAWLSLKAYIMMTVSIGREAGHRCWLAETKDG